MEGRANTSAEIQLTWGPGTYVFKLGGKQIEHLQKACEASLGTIAGRLFAGISPRANVPGVDYRDVYHTLHLGLIGGGMPAVEATRICQQWVDGRALDPPRDPGSNLKTAQAVISAAFFGFEDIKTEKDDDGDPKRQAGEPLTA